MITYNFLIATNDNYVKYTGVLITSIKRLHKNKTLCFHILADNITVESEKWLRNLEDAKSEINIYNVNEENIAFLKSYKGNLTTWYRILFEDYLDVNRIITNGDGKLLYLDVDMVVVEQLDELFNTDISNYSIGVCPDVCVNPQRYNVEHYFCAGTLLINVEFWKNNNIKQQLIDWAKSNLTHEGDLPDQDTLNVVCENTKLLLSIKYNFLLWFHYKGKFEELNPEFITSADQAKECPAIVHFATANPWHHFASAIFCKNRWKWCLKWYFNAIITSPLYFSFLIFPVLWRSMMAIYNKQNRSYRD